MAESAKANARFNLISVLESHQQQEKRSTNASPSSSGSPSPPDNSDHVSDAPSVNVTPSTTSQTPSTGGKEITAEFFEQERIQRAKSIVKTLQVEMRGPPPTPPPKSPTVRRPHPRQRSPLGPSRQKTIADPTTRTSRNKTPPRPPPPKLGAMHKMTSLDVEGGMRLPHQPSVTPPTSPMRRRSQDLDKIIPPPRPTVRKRKNKFQQQGEEEKKTGSLERSGESKQDIEMAGKSHDQVDGDAPVQQGSSEEASAVDKSGEGETSSNHAVEKTGPLERSGEEVGSGGGENSTNQNAAAENHVDEGTAEGWEIVTDIPNISVEDQSEAKNQRSTLQKQSSEEASPSHADEMRNERNPLRKQASESAATTHSVVDTPTSATNSAYSSQTLPSASDLKKMPTKRKKPPPFRPPPYTPKTPPVPPKARKTVSTKLAIEAKEVRKIVKAEEASPESTPEPEEHRQQKQNEYPNDHVYEMIEPMQAPTPLRLVDNGLGPGRTKYLGSSSSDTSISPSHTLSRSTSIGNSDSVLQGNGSATMSLSNLRSFATRAEGGRKMRPQSEASSNTSVRDLETSFEMIPGSGSKLEDVMSTLKETDETLQDASIYELVQACSRAMPHITTTTELPPRIPEFPTDTRSLVIHELYSTEYTYVKGLEVVDEVFKVELAPVLLDETSRVFANIYDILAFNKGFLALLHTRLTDWGPEVNIGDIFIGMFTPSHKSMYSIYCSNYDTAEMLVVNRLKRRKDFELALQACLSNSRVLPGLTLPAYLITPVQRVPRYILLLKDIIKNTPDTHPDHKNLVKALEIMGELADYINAQVSESQTKKTLDTLKNKVQGLADLDSPDRNLVKEGLVFLKNVKKLYRCILFNDLLVFAHGDTRQSTVELQLDLEAVWVEDLEDLDPQTSNEDAIEVYTPERPYTIYTQTRAEKTLWLNKLRETIYQHLRDKDKCKASKEFNIESRKAQFVYADQRLYNGQYLDARRSGEGTMTWPNKSCYKGHWIDDERCGQGEFVYNTGDTYRGKWEEDRQTGFGELQYASDDIYRGYWKDGVRHGKGTILYSNGDKFEGNFNNGHIEGKGALKCVNGVEYSGDWKHSQRHGKGRLRFVCGNVYNGEFQYNQIHGQGRMVYKNKDTYDGRWKNGMKNGQGKFVSKREGEYDGSWENDLRHGFGKLKYPNGDYYEGGWELNRRHGRGKLIYSTGQVFEGEFINGVVSGDGEMRYSKVSKYQGNWVNGLRHGFGAMVYEDRSSYNGDWQNDLRNGHGEFVSADGAVFRGMWVNDKQHGKGVLTIAGPQQNLSYTYSGDWVCGKREGRGEEQSQYGQYKGGWKADMKQGVGEERTLVGTIFEGTWDKGRKHGRGVRKMIFGTVEEQIWKSGQLTTDPLRMTAVELPYISRSDL